MLPRNFTSCSTPKPRGQVKRTVRAGSGTNTIPSASPSTSPPSPVSAGPPSFEAKPKSSMRPCARNAPPCAPAISTACRRACGRAVASHVRSPGANRSLSAATASSGPASTASARTAMRRPPASSRPSSDCAFAPAPTRSFGASTRQPPSTSPQRARPSTRPRSAEVAAPFASGAPSRRMPSIATDAVTATTRCACRSSQVSARPCPRARRTPAMRNSGDHAAKSARFAAMYARPSPLPRRKSRVPSSGAASLRIVARTPARTRSPLTCRRRSTRGRIASTPSAGAITRSFAPTSCSSPRRSKVANGSPPCFSPGKPRTCQLPSACRSRVRSRPRTRNSVNERPGSRPAYCDTRISASPISSACAPEPTRRRSRRSSGPRRVHSVSTLSNATGRPARALSHAAMRSGWRSANGSNWLIAPAPNAIATSNAATA